MSDPSLDFKSLHDQFRPRVLRYLTRMVGEADAEDLTQAVMLKASEGLSTFRGDSSISTWLYRIATNAALDKLRQRRTQSLVETEQEFNEEELPAAADTASVETAAIREEMSACIGEFVAGLPENYKTVMILSEIEGFRNDEIAAMLGLTLDTVKIRLHRAREKLRKDLHAGCTFYRDDADELACDRKLTAPVTFSHRR
jgi:RNA polymerase sigma-70 factor, ECF subfamily